MDIIIKLVGGENDGERVKLNHFFYPGFNLLVPLKENKTGSLWGGYQTYLITERKEGSAYCADFKGVW